MHDSNLVTSRASPQAQRDLTTRRIKAGSMTGRFAHKTFGKSFAGFREIAAHACGAITVGRVVRTDSGTCGRL